MPSRMSMAAAYGAAALVALLTLTFPSIAQVPIQDRGGEPGDAFTPSHSLDNSELLGEGYTKTVSDGLYMSGVWVATYGANYSTVSITLPYIYNYSSFYTGTLRLSYWATTSYPARGAGFTGYRLATFGTTFAPLAPGYYYYDIVRNSSMLVPPNGTYWLILVLEEYDPAYCSDASGYCLVDSLISSSQRTFGPVTVNLAVTQNVQPSQTNDGKDVIFDGTISNVGSNAATNVRQVSQIPTGTDFVWASPECTVSSGTVTCNFGTMTSGATRQYRLVVRLRRPSFVAGTTHRAEVMATETDSAPSNNVHFGYVAVVSTPNGTPVSRYRLYSDVTKEHHFTTDANEYNILGAYVGTWVQEGTVGKVLNNPGAYNGVPAVPYYRLYDLGTRWHHWTTDANEYYTLGTFPGWVMEGVDGYILPTPAAGARQLYRLNYPALGALHHWTIDLNEYNVLTTVYGWVGEGGSGFVIQ